MSEVVLTPRIASTHGWSIYAHCENCRVMRPLDKELINQGNPDRDLAEALMRGKFRCSKCGHSCSALSVSRQPHGRTIPVMMLTPGLTIQRYEDEYAQKSAPQPKPRGEVAPGEGDG